MVVAGAVEQDGVTETDLRKHKKQRGGGAEGKSEADYFLVYLTCKRGSVGQSEGLSIPRSSVRFPLKPDNSNSHEFELHRPSNKGTKLLLKVIKAIIIIAICLPLDLSTVSFLARASFFPFPPISPL